MYEINSVKQLLYNNDVVYRCSKSHQLIIAQCNIHRHPWSSSSDMLLHSHSSDRYNVQVDECVMTHASPQVDIITCTFLVLTSFLCSTGAAALRRHTAFSVPTPSPLHLFRCFPILSESVLLPPMVQITHNLNGPRMSHVCDTHGTHVSHAWYTRVTRRH